MTSSKKGGSNPLAAEIYYFLSFRELTLSVVVVFGARIVGNQYTGTKT